MAILGRRDETIEAVRELGLEDLSDVCSGDEEFEKMLFGNIIRRGFSYNTLLEDIDLRRIHTYDNIIL